MGKQRSRQLQDGRGTSNYQYKKEGGAVGWLGTAKIAAIVQDKLGFESKDDNTE